MLSDYLQTVDWSRAQFAMTAIYHWLFVPLTLGLGFILAIMETLYVRTGDEFWKRTTKFWMRLFGNIGGVDYTFNGVKEVQKKMQLLVDNNTGGCMYFDMGNDVSVQDELSLIRALSMTIHSNVDTLVTKVSTDPVGIEEKKLYPELNSAKVSVYPNPSDGNFQVDLPFSGEAVCDLFSMTGNKVYSTIGEKQIRFSLSGILSTGLYILKIDSSEGQATTKVQIK